jgi:hypothetical protein
MLFLKTDDRGLTTGVTTDLTGEKLPLTISHMSLSINDLVGYSQADDGSRQ